MPKLNSAVGLLVLGLLLHGHAPNVSAQAYPAKAIRLMVAVSAGSGTDTVGRIIAAGISEVLGQQVVVENRAGAAGNIGAEIVARAPADGYTLLQSNIAYAANVSLYRNLSYDLVRDFAPVTQFATGPYVVVVHPSVPVKSFAELVKLTKARPGDILYSSGGSGTASFLAAELFNAQAGVRMLHVPYKAGAEALSAVVGCEVAMHFAPLATALPQIHGKRLRPLAVSSTKRLSLLPEQPTIAELGYRGYEFGNWYGLLAPAKTPREVIATLNRATIRAMNLPSVSKRLGDLGYISVGDQPEEFAAYIKLEIDKLSKVIRALNLTAE